MINSKKYIYSISKRISNQEVQVTDAFGRKRNIAASSDFSVGDRVVIVNGIMTTYTPKETIKTFTV